MMPDDVRLRDGWSDGQAKNFSGRSEGELRAISQKEYGIGDDQ